MRRREKLVQGGLTVACLAAGCVFLVASCRDATSSSESADRPRVDQKRQGGGGGSLHARAIIYNASGVEVGEARFTESPLGANEPLSSVEVVARVAGLSPGLHGFHIHENGVCEPPGFTSAGGHFDPGPFGNSTPVDANHPYHLGDLPNLEANKGGVGHLRATTNRVRLSQHPGALLSVFDANGSAVIVHLNPDLGVNGVVGASGGPRVACGVIQLEH